MASFYNSYMTSATQKPSKPGEPDTPEWLPGGGPSSAPAWSTSQAGTSAFGAQGAQSPASQIQTTGNTGMEAKKAATAGGGSATTPPTAQTTTGTPSSATGSGLPSYGANWQFNWQAGQLPQPGANTAYQAPSSLAAMGVNFSNLGYNSGSTAPGWTAPQGDSSAAHSALNAILSGSGSGMDTSALKNKLKEQRLSMAKDERDNFRQSEASRGMLDSGMASAGERRIGSAARKDILGGFRDIDIADADLGTKNKMVAATALNQLLTGDTERADTGFDNTLDTAKFEDDKTRWGSNFNLLKEKAALEAAMGLEENKQKAAGIGIEGYKAGTETSLAEQDQEIEIAKGKTNELLGRMGLAVNLEELARGSSRDKMQFLTDIFDILVRNEQFNSQMGFNYSQLGGSMNEMMANIAKSIGVG
jgi:hypothetical protein